MLGSKNILTGSGNARLDTMQRLTSPGMVDWVDLDGDKHCASCRHYHKHHCMLFAQVMRSRLKNSRFLGPKLPRSQRACRRYEKAHDAGAFGRASTRETNDMKISEKYPAKGLLKAADVQGGDLVVQIDRVDENEELGDSGKKRFADLLRFTNDERSLELKPTNARAIAALHGDDTDLWPGKYIALFYDPTVKFGEETTGGVRVRPSVPTEEEIAAAAPPTRKPGSAPAKPPSGDGRRPSGPSLDDEIPF
jgi:hypothetical protein